MASPGDSKRRRVLPSSGEGSGPSPGPSEDTRPTADGQIQFDMEGVTKRYGLQGERDNSGDIPYGTNKVIGWCQLPGQEVCQQSGQGVWLVVHNASIACLDVCRCVRLTREVGLM